MKQALMGKASLSEVRGHILRAYPEQACSIHPKMYRFPTTGNSLEKGIFVEPEH